MSARRVAVDGSGRGALPCPRCGGEVTVQVAGDLLRHSTPVRVRVRCACGWGGWAEVERRAAARKAVDVPVRVLLGEEELEVRATDMSRTGLRIEPAPEGLEPGGRATVRFELCPGRPQRFEKRVVVRWVEAGAAGCQFVDGEGGPAYDPLYDLALAQHPGAR